MKVESANIYSSNGDVLAQNVTSYKLIAYLDPSRTIKKNNPQHVVDKEKTAEALAPILEMDKEEILHYLNKENVYQTEFGTKGKNLTELVKQKIEALNLPGLDFYESYKRYYPKGEFASYTLGYAKSNVNEETGEETKTVYVRNAYLKGESKADKIYILNKNGISGAIESIAVSEEPQVSGNTTQYRTNYTLTFSGGKYNASLVVSSDWH